MTISVTLYFPNLVAVLEPKSTTLDPTFISNKIPTTEPNQSPSTELSFVPSFVPSREPSLSPAEAPSSSSSYSPTVMPLPQPLIFFSKRSINFSLELVEDENSYSALPQVYPMIVFCFSI